MHVDPRQAGGHKAGVASRGRETLRSAGARFLRHDGTVPAEPTCVRGRSTVTPPSSSRQGLRTVGTADERTQRTGERDLLFDESRWLVGDDAINGVVAHASVVAPPVWGVISVAVAADVVRELVVGRDGRRVAGRSVEAGQVHFGHLDAERGERRPKEVEEVRGVARKRHKPHVALERS